VRAPAGVKVIEEHLQHCAVEDLHDEVAQRGASEDVAHGHLRGSAKGIPRRGQKAGSRAFGGLDGGEGRAKLGRTSCFHRSTHPRAPTPEGVVL
jgi:hypothetical protein